MEEKKQIVNRSMWNTSSTIGQNGSIPCSLVREALATLSTLRQAARVAESPIARIIKEIASISRQDTNEVISTEQQLHELQGDDFHDLQQALALPWKEALERVWRIVENHTGHLDHKGHNEEQSSALEAHAPKAPSTMTACDGASPPPRKVQTV